MTRLDSTHVARTPRGATLSRRGWLTHAPLRMLTAALQCLIPAAIVALLSAGPAAAESPVAAATEGDLIAVYSQHTERRLLRLRFDRAAGKVSFAPFGPPGVENFAVAPRGAFVVYAAAHGEEGSEEPHLFMLDEAGHALGKPLLSPIGAVATLAVSPKGDWVAASNGRGWIALLAVERTRAARRLVARATFGVSPHRAFAYAFRPEGGIVTLADDWVLTYRAPDGSVQRTIDLKIANRGLSAMRPGENAEFKVVWSPRGDRFAVLSGPGPLTIMIFGRTGRRLQLRGTEEERHPLAMSAEFVAGGDGLIVSGINKPVLIRMGPLTSTAFGEADTDWGRFVSLAGGRGIAVVTEEKAALWSSEGKRLVAPAGLENYRLVVAAAGADDEAIVAAERGGWVDLYTLEGKFVRRVQSGARGSFGHVALSADGTVAAAFANGELGVFAQPGGRLWGGAYPADGWQAAFVAVSADGHCIAAAGPGIALRSWSRSGDNAVTFALGSGGEAPDRLIGLAVSTTGNAIAVAGEKSAVWIAYPADGRVLRVPVAGGVRSIAALPNDIGFAIGLDDGTVIRMGRDGAVQGAPLKASEQGAVRRIAVAPDGQSLIAVEGDESAARHLAWDGKLLAGPFQASRFDYIKGAFFRNGAPMLIAVWSKTDSAADLRIRLADFAAPSTRWTQLDRPPP